MKFSVIVSVKNDSVATWHTVNNIFLQLEKNCNDFEIIVIDDDSDNYMLRDYFNDKDIDSSIRYEKIIVNTPALAKGYGASIAKGDLLFLVDSHVALSDNFYKEIEEFFLNNKKAKIAYIPIKRKPGGSTVAHHRIHWNSDFWWDWEGLISDKPYKCASGGHGAFIIKKKFFDEIGGFTKYLNGYGGEEVYLDTLSWIAGGENWILPQIYQIHNDWARDYVQELKKMKYNHVVISYLLGGKEYSDRVISSYANDMSENVYSSIRETLKEEREKIKNYKINLNNLLNKFQREGIPY